MFCYHSNQKGVVYILRKYLSDHLKKNNALVQGKHEI